MNTDDDMDALFAALAHATRRRILDVVKARPGCRLNEVCAQFPVSRIAIMKHLRLLEAADLICSEKIGRTRRLYFNAVPIQMICDRWTTELSEYWATQMTDMKYKLERGVVINE